MVNSLSSGLMRFLLFRFSAMFFLFGILVRDGGGGDENTGDVFSSDKLVVDVVVVASSSKRNRITNKPF